MAYAAVHAVCGTFGGAAIVKVLTQIYAKAKMPTKWDVQIASVP